MKCKYDKFRECFVFKDARNCWYESFGSCMLSYYDRQEKKLKR